MYLDNLREAVKLAKSEGIVSRPLAQTVILEKGPWKAYLYQRMLTALNKLAVNYLINANR